MMGDGTVNGSQLYQSDDPNNLRPICQIHALWKRRNLFSELGWCLVNTNMTPTLMSTKRQRKSLSSLHAELEALSWPMDCMVMHHALNISFQTDCSELVKMVSNTEV